MLKQIKLDLFLGAVAWAHVMVSFFVGWLVAVPFGVIAADLLRVGQTATLTLFTITALPFAGWAYRGLGRSERLGAWVVKGIMKLS